MTSPGPMCPMDADVPATLPGRVIATYPSAWYAPSSAVVEMVDAVLRDKKKILPGAAYLDGEYGMRDVYLGVPIKLGRKGIEQIVEIALTESERQALEKSAAAVRDLFRILKS